MTDYLKLAADLARGAWPTVRETEDAMSPKYLSNLAGEAEQLLAATRGCRPDMHEPDEQGLSAKVTGKAFDNAGFPERELTLRLTRDVDDGGVAGTVTSLNLASVVALARLGAETLLRALDVGGGHVR